eukprot:COSAG06_NODE_28904_length_565_cov_20.240343_1_plen_38_part_10
MNERYIHHHDWVKMTELLSELTLTFTFHCFKKHQPNAR